MLQKLIERRHKGTEEGFTLIELMVVVLIIAILIAIAIPTFLGARERANNRAAQSSLRNSLTAAKTLFTDANTYVGSDATALQGVEPSLAFKAAGTDSTGPKEVSVSPNSATEWVAAVKSASGKCYFIKDESNGPGTSFATVSSPTNCQAGTPPAANTFSTVGFP
jgi:type IV pilus assembly protein PilA